jgi:hypothetical protein
MHNSLDINFATDTLLSDEVDPILSPREDLMKLDEEVRRLLELRLVVCV